MNPIKDILLFVGGLVGAVAAGVAAVQGPSVATLSALAAAVVALLCNYLWFSSTSLSVSALNDKSLDELRALAKSLHIAKSSSFSKRRVLEALREPVEKGEVTERRWRAWKWALLVCGLIAVPAINWKFPDIKSVPPKYAFAWYENTNGRLKIVDPQTVKHDLLPEEVFANKIRVPVNLAMRNDDNVALDVVRVELRYGADLDVHSDGRAKIDPTGRTLVYEHEIGTLDKVDDFTPLQPIDFLEIPFHFIKDRLITLSKDDIPIQVGTIVGQDVIGKKQLSFDIKVFCKDRPTIEGQVNINIQTGVQVLPDISYAKKVASQPGDADYFSDHLPFVRRISAWSGKISPQGKTVEYELLDTDRGRVQRVAVDGVIRRVVVDESKSGTISFILLRPDAGNPPFARMQFDTQWPLIDWPAAELH